MMMAGTAVYPPPKKNPRIELTSKDRAKPINGASTGPSPGWKGGNSTSTSAKDVPSEAARDADGWRMFYEFVNGIAKAAREEKNKQAQAPPPPPEPVTKQPATSVVPPIDPNDDPLGPGGFITPPGLASRAPEPVATKDVAAKVCVPVTLLDRGWASQQRSVKMEAFEAAIRKTIRELALAMGANTGTQFMVMDKFIGFDQATTDSLSLVMMVNRDGMQDCPAGNHPYTLDVKTRQRSER